MAFRATASSWGSMLRRLGENRNGFATAAAPRTKPFGATADSVHGGGDPHHPKKGVVPGEFAPVAVVLGLLLVAISIGGHTAKQQLVHSPGVQIRKKRRESVPEVEDPDRVINSADKFLSKSFLRKVGHIQDSDPTLHDPQRADPFTKPRRAETLKTVGVESGRPRTE